SCATGWRICGNGRVSSPAADAVVRGTRVAALPNLLTLVRVGLVPVLMVALLWPTPAARAVAALAFLVACITDFLDGWLARRHGMTTALGQLLEALLLHYRYPIPGTGLEIDFHAGGMLFLWMALVLAVWSGVDYYVRILRQIRLD